eukprot:TRINITY_DN9580_c0_g1_i3.p1 TRINITY_DN9580_c0_g1~~TRINITY_DN9580_c0_g1_i3.p1  ORF type:complete len:105 (+),score=7.46 TRINITY_DN9580_c0_g1_i3:69-383(+)
MMHIQKRLLKNATGPVLTHLQNLIEPHRKFIKEGVVVSVSKGQQKRKHIALFSDVLYISDDTTKTSKKVSYKNTERFALDNLSVSMLPPTPGVKFNQNFLSLLF